MELFNTPYGHITLYKNETYISKSFKSYNIICRFILI